MQKISFFLAIMMSLSLFVYGQQTEYPSNIGWVSVKDYGAVGDGVTDDTKAIQKAITTYPHKYHKRIILYFPDGEYIVSDTLKYLTGWYDYGVTLHGQSREGTIIKLADNADGYGDPSAPKPIIYTKAGNASFKQYIFNMTINTGKNNDGAIAVDYISNNTGAIKNVSIVSEDGKGYCGLSMERAWPGPALIKNVMVKGFQYGIRLAEHEFNMVFEDITVKNQTVCGLWNSENSMVIRNLHSYNTVKAIENDGQLVLLNGYLHQGNANEVAINNTSFVYARNVSAPGYSSVLSTEGDTLPLHYLPEYCNRKVHHSFPYEGGMMLNLPVKETPVYYNNDTSQWVNARAEYGARPTDLKYGFFDATEEIQNAFNSGKPVIHFPPEGSEGSSYHIFDTVYIPASVKLITGMGFAGITVHDTAALIVNEDSPAPLIFKRMGTEITNLSSRDVVIKHSGGRYSNGPNSGDLFLEDYVGRIHPKYPMNLWARQLNTEVQDKGDSNIVNRGKKYWILGQKTEGKATVNKTVNGGYSEILGGLIYPTGSFGADDSVTAAMIGKNGSISAIFAKAAFTANGMYPVWARETWGNTTKTYPTGNLNHNTALFRGGGSPDYFSIYLESPRNNASFSEQDPVTIDAKLFGEPSSADVFFYVNDSLLGSTSVADYSFTWNNPPLGDHYVYAKAVNQEGDTVVSTLREIFIAEGISCEGTGTIVYEKWNNIGEGDEVSLIPLDQDPDEKSYLRSFQTEEGQGDQYGGRVSGYVCPPYSGDYVFYITSDDNGELWLSTDTREIKKELIASVPDWASPGEYDKFSSQQSDPVSLEAGKKYYIEGLVKENSGGDHISVGWKLPNGNLERPIPGVRLIPSEKITEQSNADRESTKNEIKIFPQPAIHRLHITLPDAYQPCKLTLYNSLGQMVNVYQLSDNPNVSIYVNDLNPGLYLLEFKNDQSSVRKPVIIQNK